MVLHHSEETHKQLLDRVPAATGRGLPEWFQAMEAGPAFLRFDDRVNWLRTEHEISHGHATAIVHEYDKHRAQRSMR
jgi:hypothetical protein